MCLFSRTFIDARHMMMMMMMMTTMTNRRAATGQREAQRASTANGVSISPAAFLRNFTFKTPNVNIYRGCRSQVSEIRTSPSLTCRHLVIAIITDNLTYRLSFHRYFVKLPCPTLHTCCLLLVVIYHIHNFHFHCP